MKTFVEIFIRDLKKKFGDGGGFRPKRAGGRGPFEFCFKRLKPSTFFVHYVYPALWFETVRVRDTDFATYEGEPVT